MMPTETPPKPKQPKMNAKKRTMDLLKSRGYDVESTEKQVEIKQGTAFQGRKLFFTKDLYGYQDVQAVGCGHAGVWALQCTSRQQIAKHLKDYRRNPEIADKIRNWLAHGNRFSIIGWKYQMVPKVRGNGLKGVWEFQHEPVYAEMLEPNAADLVAIKAAEEEAARVKEEQARKRRAKRTAAQKVRDETKELFT